MTRRLLAIIIVFLAILILPYWVYIPILGVAIILLPFFWEGLLLAFLIEVFYGHGITSSLLISPSALIVLVLLVVLLPIRTRLRSYV